MYQTNFEDGSISKFASDGSIEASRWATVAGHPESCAVATDGDVYVGITDPGSLVQFASDGTVVKNLAPQSEDRGVDWISWGSDHCVIRYTSEGSTIFQFNVCNDAQLPALATDLPGPCFENAALSHGLLVACSSAVIRLDDSGATVQTYPSPGSELFALAVQPGQRSFWVADYNGGVSTVFRIDLSSGKLVSSFVPNPETDVAGLTQVP